MRAAHVVLLALGRDGFVRRAVGRPSRRILCAVASVLAFSLCSSFPTTSVFTHLSSLNPEYTLISKSILAPIGTQADTDVLKTTQIPTSFSHL